MQICPYLRWFMKFECVSVKIEEFGLKCQLQISAFFDDRNNNKCLL